ncbi:MAG: hypothetical protein GY941_23735 [Planctomycetes bacterium]|nr:hypothetical protein [Planctomycetota bacterium]
MSRHSAFFDDTGFPGLSEFFGETATYQPGTGDAVPDCDVVLTRDVVIQPTSYEATTVIVGDTLEAYVDQVGDLAEGDTFTMDVGGVVYTCIREIENNGKITKWVVNGS